VWALGVGIVLVGEYTGWNFAADKGGALAALIICWVVGLLYTSVAMIDSEVTSTVAAAGGQYAQAKHIVGPLMAFNVALYLVFAYTMLENPMRVKASATGTTGASLRQSLSFWRHSITVAC
jgi:ethanolamine permease